MLQMTLAFSLGSEAEHCWACRNENATVTAYCLTLLDSELRPLKQCEAEGSLLPQVPACHSMATPELSRLQRAF